jgi:hypothetical protein
MHVSAHISFKRLKWIYLSRFGLSLGPCFRSIGQETLAQYIVLFALIFPHFRPYFESLWRARDIQRESRYCSSSVVNTGYPQAREGYIPQ